MFDDILNDSFYQNILYKKTDKDKELCFKSIQKVFTDIELEKNSNILLVSNKNVVDVVNVAEQESKLKAFDFFDMSTVIKEINFGVKKTMRSFIDASGCEFIKNEIIKNNENTQEICSDISLLNTIENYYELDDFSKKINEYIKENNIYDIKDLEKVSKLDKKYPPYELWTEYYKVNSILDLIELVSHKTRKK